MVKVTDCFSIKAQPPGLVRVKSSGAALGSGAKVQSPATLLRGLTPASTLLRGSSEHDKIKTIREYGHQVLSIIIFKVNKGTQRSPKFYALTTYFILYPSLCRRFPRPSQQLCKEYGLFFLNEP